MAVKELLDNRELRGKILQLVAVERAIAKEKKLAGELWGKAQGIDQDADIYKLAWWVHDEEQCKLKRKRKEIIHEIRAMVLRAMGLS